MVPAICISNQGPSKTPLRSGVMMVLHTSEMRITSRVQVAHNQSPCYIACRLPFSASQVLKKLPKSSIAPSRSKSSACCSCTIPFCPLRSCCDILENELASLLRGESIAEARAAAGEECVLLVLRMLFGTFRISNDELCLGTSAPSSRDVFMSMDFENERAGGVCF